MTPPSNNGTPNRATLDEHDSRDGEEFRSEDFESDGEAPDDLKRELYHDHLPYLADEGFIDWDPETNTVTRGPRFEEIEPLLRLMDDHRDELPDGWP